MPCRPKTVSRATLVTIVTFVIGTFLTLVVTQMLLGSGQANYCSLCLAMVANSLLMFALPGLISRRYIVGKIRPHMNIMTSPVSIAFSVIILALVCQPFIAWASYVNEQFMEWAPMVSLFGSDENDPTSVLLSQVIMFDSPLHWIISILVVALIPAVSEELLFRGAFMPLLRRGSGSWHFAIVGSALIFSILHMDAAGLLPRAIMGGILGALLLVTKQLWAPMLFHFTNNISVIITLALSDKSVEENLNTPSEDLGVILPIISVLFTLAEIHFIGTQTGFHVPDYIEELDKKINKR